MTREESQMQYVRCEQGNNVYLVPKDVFSRVVMAMNIPNKKYVRYKTGAYLYDMSERQFKDLARDAKAIRKLNRMVLVDVNALDSYIGCFTEY